MKKLIMTVFVVGLVFTLTGYALAITGQCSNCHVMHDSQGGSNDEGASGAQEQLLIAGCAGCHTTSGTGQTTSWNAPAVLHSSGPSSGTGPGSTLAGGDFYWVTQAGGDAKGHNVADISGVGQDGTIGLTPPGWDYNATKQSVTGYSFGQITGGDNSSWSSQLTCAGRFGCHGNHTATTSLDAVSGAHHSNSGVNDQVTTPTSVAASYRFLAGIKGLEASDWEWGATSSSHNEYYGQNDTSTERDDDTTDSYANTDTISFFCAECHGYFHSRIDSDATFGSPWVRHPTDIVLPNSGEYDDYNSDNGDNTAGPYNITVPVARPAVPSSSSSTVTPGDDTTATGAIVMCLSCHRAHGSEYNDLLRFDYTQVTVGSGNTTGCFVCHTDKN